MSGSLSACTGIFISYRRADSAYPAGWLFDRLVEHFGRDQVFKDVDSLEPGDDFAEAITTAVASCAALVAVIGERWLAISMSTDGGAWTTLRISCAWRSRPR